MTGSVTLTVTPEELNIKAQEVSDRIKEIRGHFEEMNTIASGKTSGYWIGNAGDSYRKKYQSFQPEIEEILKRLSEYVTDLRQMAGVYEAAENAAAELAQDLPDNVII